MEPGEVARRGMSEWEGRKNLAGGTGSWDRGL